MSDLKEYLGDLRKNDAPCAFCGEMTNSLSANPSEWPLCFCWPEGTGTVKRHHVKCVTDRLFRRTHAHDAEMARWYEQRDKEV